MASDRVVLVAGAGGYIGQRLLLSVRQAWPQARVVGIARRAPPGGLALDLRDADATAQLLAELQPDVVFQLAGVIQSSDWEELYRTNVLTTLNVLQALSSAPGCNRARVVVAGSAAEYGLVDAQALPVREDSLLNPVLPYGVSKAWQTTLARAWAARGLDVVVGRIFNVFGTLAPTTTSLGAFAQQIRQARDTGGSGPLMVGNLSPRRDFVDIHDIADALIALAERGRQGGVYNICSGRSVSVGDALQQMIQLSGTAVRVLTDPARVRPVDVPDIRGSLARIEADTGWLPRVAFETSLRAMLA
jgi:GDP-4-dehydro-6-deoxy-D-mannose reductase